MRHRLAFLCALMVFIALLLPAAPALGETSDDFLAQYLALGEDDKSGKEQLVQKAREALGVSLTYDLVNKLAGDTHGLSEKDMGEAVSFLFDICLRSDDDYTVFLDPNTSDACRDFLDSSTGFLLDPVVIAEEYGLGYREVVARGWVTRYFAGMQASAFVQSWVTAEPDALFEALPHYTGKTSADTFRLVPVPEARLNAGAPWGYAMEPAEAGVVVIFFDERNSPGVPQWFLGQMAQMPTSWYAKSPWAARYALVMETDLVSVGRYSPGNGTAYRQNIRSTVYDVATGEALWTNEARGGNPPDKVQGSSDGYGGLPVYEVNTAVQAYLSGLLGE